MNYKLSVIEYLVNRCDLAEREYDEYKDFCRYANVDEVEMLEQIVRKIRRDLLRETLRDVMHIFSLTKGK